MKQDSYWARTDQKKADIFAERLFTPNIREINLEEETILISKLPLKTQYQTAQTAETTSY